MNNGSAELLQEVAGHLVSVEEGLAALDNHKTALHNHANMVKGEISSAIERHMAALRAKEKQLIRQVEVASTHQNSDVNVTQAQLLQHKGALAVTRTILDNCSTTSSTSDSSGRCTASSVVSYKGNTAASRADWEDGSEVGITVRNTIASTVNCLPHQDVAGLLEHTEKLLRVPLVSVSVEESVLSGAIQRFGRVSSPPTLSHSELLPQCLEEYGDDEHHVLHKSVQPDRAIGAPIDVRRPYLLAAKKLHGINSAAVQYRKQTPSCPIPVAALVKSAECGAKEDLVKWLRRMQLDTSTEDTRPTGCCGDKKGCGDVCIEEVCQANELCGTFSNCLMSGQCKKNALEKIEQSAQWQQQEMNQLLQQWCSPRKQEQKQHVDLDTSNLQFAMDLSICSRKRQHSESGEAVRSVLAHMTGILNSSSGSWLINKANKLGNNINNCTVANVLGENNVGSAVMKQDSCKKMKVDHSDTASLNHSNNLRSAVLYMPPHGDWVLPGVALTKTPENVFLATVESTADRLAASMLDDTDNKDRTQKGNGVWLLPAKEMKFSQVSKKANCDKENNLCRASIMKSQLSLGSMECIENLKDKIERASTESNKVSSMMIDLEEKESWLLQQCSTVQADNKVLEEVMKKKAEWLSDSSLASFSIITDPDVTSNCWLLGQQL